MTYDTLSNLARFYGYETENHQTYIKILGPNVGDEITISKQVCGHICMFIDEKMSNRVILDAIDLAITPINERGEFSKEKKLTKLEIVTFQPPNDPASTYKVYKVPGDITMNIRQHEIDGEWIIESTLLNRKYESIDLEGLINIWNFDIQGI